MEPIDADYRQSWLLPPSIEDWIPAEHPARFIRELVAGLDLNALGFEEQKPHEGRRPYAHALLLRAWLYGYWKQITSSRKLETACKEDLGFIWLCGGHQPDHNSLWRFYAKYSDCFSELFKTSVKIAMNLELVGRDLQALDGTKIQAKCAGPTGYTVKDLHKLDEHLDAQIGQLEAMIEEAAEQADAGELSDIPEALQEKKALKEKVEEALAEAEDAGVEHIHPEDPQARRMKCEGRNRFSYNAQAVVDNKHQVIVAADVCNHPSDQAQLVRMLKQARTIRGCDVLSLADGGYASASEFARVDYLGFPLLCNLSEKQRSQPENRYHASHFVCTPDGQSVRCPEGRDIPYSRTRLKGSRWVRVYRSAEVCKGCPAFGTCTRDRHGRSIDIVAGMWALRDMEHRINEEDAKAKLAYRKGIVEPVFARIKQHGGFRRWSVGGLKKVGGQWQLLCAIHNLKIIFKYGLTQRQLAGMAAENGRFSYLDAPTQSFLAFHHLARAAYRLLGCLIGSMRASQHRYMPHPLFT